LFGAADLIKSRHLGGFSSLAGHGNSGLITRFLRCHSSADSSPWPWHGSGFTQQTPSGPGCLGNPAGPVQFRTVKGPPSASRDGSVLPQKGVWNLPVRFTPNPSFGKTGRAGTNQKAPHWEGLFPGAGRGPICDQATAQSGLKRGLRYPDGLLASKIVAFGRCSFLGDSPPQVARPKAIRPIVFLTGIPAIFFQSPKTMGFCPISAPLWRHAGWLAPGPLPGIKPPSAVRFASLPARVRIKSGWWATFGHLRGFSCLSELHTQ